MAKNQKKSQPEPEQLSLFDFNPATENSEDNNIDVELDDYDEFDPADIGDDESGSTE